MEELVQAFFSNVIELCRRRLNRLPSRVREEFDSWAEKLAKAFKDSRLAHAIASGLEKLRNEASELGDALIAEIEAVVALQNYALQSRSAAGTLTPENGVTQSAARVESLAMRASRTLLGSFREAIWYLPDWAKGLIKVGEEIIEIFGPAR